MLLFTACKKSIEVKQVAFDVSSAKTNGQQTANFKTTDTIIYNFSGNADVVTFYSGAIGRRYEFRDRTTADGTPQLQFSTVRATGSQANSLQLLISSDFKGAVPKLTIINGTITRDTAATNVNIAAATWTDISNRATWSTGSTTATPSGVIDLSDYKQQGKPIYIAFKYLAAAGSIQNKWTITNFSLKNLLADGSNYTQANFAASNQSITNYGVNSPGLGWMSHYDESLNAKKVRWVYTTGVGTAGSLVITGAATAATATDPVESWAIVGPVDLRKVTPDAGIGIKEITAQLTNYTSLPVYTTAGTYKATFVASNNTVSGSSVVVKELPITINP